MVMGAASCTLNSMVLSWLKYQPCLMQNLSYYIRSASLVFPMFQCSYYCRLYLCLIWSNQSPMRCGKLNPQTVRGYSTLLIECRRRKQLLMKSVRPRQEVPLGSGLVTQRWFLNSFCIAWRSDYLSMKFIYFLRLILQGIAKSVENQSVFLSQQSSSDEQMNFCEQVQKSRILKLLLCHNSPDRKLIKQTNNQCDLFQLSNFYQHNSSHGSLALFDKLIFADLKNMNIHKIIKIIYIRGLRTNRMKNHAKESN